MKGLWEYDEEGPYHCIRCVRSFLTLAAFDQHKQSRRCLSPAAAGLVHRRVDGYDMWTLPEA